MRLIQTAILVGLVGLGVYYFNDIYEFLKNNLQISYGIIVAFALVTLRVVFPILWKTVLAGFFVWLSTRMSWSNIWTILFNLVVLAGAVATIVLQILQIRALLNAG